MSNGTQPEAKAGTKAATAKVAAFCVIVVVWIVLDQFAKSLFKTMEPGGIIAGPFAGLIDIRLVHNTGGAWGIFSESTVALGVFSVIVCVVIAGFFLYTVKQATALQTLSFALIVAGGIGNAIDRFAQGYVIDFIEFSFIDFPVFNIADIGVTCGFALLVLSMVMTVRSSGDASDANSKPADRK